MAALFWDLLSGLGATALTAAVGGGLLLILILIVAKLGWQFTRVEKGNTVFISKGDDMKAIWPNVGGYHLSGTEDLDGRRWLVKAEGTETEVKQKIWEFFSRDMRPRTVWFQKLFWDKWGIRFVSFLWPQVRVHKFEISRKRLKEGADERSTALKQRVVASPESPIVSSLLFLVPRPVYLEGIEIAGDNSKINLLILVVYQQVIPALPVYYLKGDFLPLLDAAVEATIVDFFASYKQEKDGSPLTYASWLRLPKGPGSPLEKYLRQINASREYYELLEKAGKTELIGHLNRMGAKPEEPTSPNLQKQIGHGIISRFGFALVSCRLVGIEPHGSTANIAEAIQQLEIEERRAKGVRAEAVGRRQAIEELATAEARRYRVLVQALIKQGVRPDAAAEVVRTQVEMEKLAGSRVTTYVRGPAGVMVPTQSHSSPPATTSPP